MTRCRLCEDTLDDAELCIVPECPYRGAAQEGRLDAATGAIRPPAPLRPAGPGRAQRLSATGPELLLALALEAGTAALGPVGVLTSLALAAFYACRDLDGGAYSPGKRLGGLRVVDDETGAPPTPQQAVVRNAPFAALFLLAAVPGLEIVAWLLLGLAGAGAALLAVVAPDGRRAGDWLAGTRVVGPDHAAAAGSERR